MNKRPIPQPSAIAMRLPLETHAKRPSNRPASRGGNIVTTTGLAKRSFIGQMPRLAQEVGGSSQCNHKSLQHARLLNPKRFIGSVLEPLQDRPDDILAKDTANNNCYDCAGWRGLIV